MANFNLYSAVTRIFGWAIHSSVISFCRRFIPSSMCFRSTLSSGAAVATGRVAYSRLI